MQVENIIPCPFCGHEGSILESHTIIHEYWGFCYGCHIKTAYYMTREEAVAAWNQRATDMELARLRKLRRACHEYFGRKTDGMLYAPQGITACPMSIQALAAIGRLLEGKE